MKKTILMIGCVVVVAAVCGYYYLKYRAAFMLKPDFPVQIEYHKTAGKALGHAQARILKGLVERGHYPGVLWDFLLSAEAPIPEDKAAQVKRVRELLQSWDPLLLDEIDGFISALELPSTDALLMLTGWGFQPDIMQGCTQVAVRGAEGNLLIGRNYDFHPNLTDRRIVILHKPDGGFVVGSSEFVIGRLEGMNQAGFYAGASFAHGIQAKSGRPQGLFFSTIIRILLDQAQTVDQGLTLIQKLPHSSPYNYLLADASGQAAAVEVGLNKTVIRRLAPNQGYLSVVNHYQSDEMKAEQFKRMNNSVVRQTFIQETMGKTQDHLNQNLRAWLSAPYPKGLALPWYRDFLGTLYSFVFDLENKQVWFSAGKPAADAYQLLSLENKPKLTRSITGKIPTD